MKKLFLVLFIAGCGASDTKTKEHITESVKAYATRYTAGGALLKDCSLYQLDQISEDEAVAFRVRALNDSLKMEAAWAEQYKQKAISRESDMKSLDSSGQSTEVIKKLIQQTVETADSLQQAAVITKKTLDSLSAVNKTGVEKKAYYNAMFSICQFSVTTLSSCDSIAFLLDKDYNIISLHLKNKL